MKVTSLLLALTMAAVAVPHSSFAEEGRNVDGIWLDDGERLKEVALPPAYR